MSRHPAEVLCGLFSSLCAECETPLRAPSGNINRSPESPMNSERAETSRTVDFPATRLPKSPVRAGRTPTECSLQWLKHVAKRESLSPDLRICLLPSLAGPILKSINQVTEGIVLNQGFPCSFRPTVACRDLCACQPASMSVFILFHVCLFVCFLFFASSFLLLPIRKAIPDPQQDIL